MPISPLAPVTDYQSMLNRIFWFTSAAALAAIWVLRVNVLALDAVLGQIDAALAWGGDKAHAAPAGTLLPALAIGILARIFRLHTQISNWLGIREQFELRVIVPEFARQMDVDLAPIPPERLASARERLMRTTFFAYVSSWQPAIDRQLVEQALDAWSWFWVGVEATLVFTLAGFGLIACGARQVGFETLGGTLGFAALGLPALRGQCRRYAIAQVRAILADRTRAAAVRAVFGKLVGETAERRMAA